MNIPSHLKKRYDSLIKSYVKNFGVSKEEAETQLNLNLTEEGVGIEQAIQTQEQNVKDGLLSV